MSIKDKCSYADDYMATRPPTCGCEVCELKWEIAKLSKDAGMRLFAFFTDTPDPSEWRAWDEVEIVFAKDEEQAKDIQRKDGCIPTERFVEITEAGFIMKAPEYIEERDF